MVRKFQIAAFAASGVLVPVMKLIEPNWLTIMGVAPSWPVLWLLPWALKGGRFKGVFAGLALGLLLDSISLGGASQIPVLVLLGFWWGHLGEHRSSSIDNSFNLGLLAFLGTAFFGLSLWFQFLLTQMSWSFSLFNAWSFQTLLSQSFLTGFLAPILCKRLLFIFRDLKLLS